MERVLEVALKQDNCKNRAYYFHCLTVAHFKHSVLFLFNKRDIMVTNVLLLRRLNVVTRHQCMPELWECYNVNICFKHDLAA